MNYNKISQLLDNGLSADEIVMTLMKTTPKLAKKIKNMLTGGLGTGEILNGLMKDPEARNADFNNARPVTASETQSLSYLRSYNSVPDSREKEALKNLQKFTKTAINVGSTVGGAYALSRAIPKAVQAIPEAMKQILPGQNQNQTKLPGVSPNAAPQAMPQIQNPPQQPPISQPNIAQPQQPIQPEVKSIDVGSLLDKSGLKKHVDDLSKRIKDPKQIAAVLYSKYPDEMKAFQKESGKNMEDAIGDYLNTNPAQSGAIPAQSPQNPVGNEMKPTESEKIDFTGMGKGMTDKLYQGLFDSLKQGKDTFAGIKDPALAKAKPAFDQGLIKSPKDLQEFLNKPKIEKSSVVASPNGIGEVKELRNGNALIDVDGKLHKVKEEELIQSPLPEKDLADLYDELIGGIENKSGEVSKNVYWAGYDPNTNELAYIPHDGGLYVYDNISPEDSKELTSMLTLRKTTGQNYLGTWTKDTPSPIGAPMSKLIKKLQSERGGKGNEYSNKFLKIYDALEPAKSAAKKKHEEQRKKKAKKPRAD